MAGNAAASVAAIVDKARTSWLKNNEVLELLESYAAAGLSVCAEPPVRPAGGQLFLFDRRVCRFFRRDGHSWRKKPDGKTIRETHEKLKVGNAETLNCYYAHADSDDGLQRRCYWQLDPERDSTVLVHYLCSTSSRAGQNMQQQRAASAELVDTGGCRPRRESARQAGRRSASQTHLSPLATQSSLESSLVSASSGGGGDGDLVESLATLPLVQGFSIEAAAALPSLAQQYAMQQQIAVQQQMLDAAAAAAAQGTPQQVAAQQQFAAAAAGLDLSPAPLPAALDPLALASGTLPPLPVGLEPFGGLPETDMQRPLPGVLYTGQRMASQMAAQHGHAAAAGGGGGAAPLPHRPLFKQESFSSEQHRALFREMSLGIQRETIEEAGGYFMGSPTQQGHPLVDALVHDASGAELGKPAAHPAADVATLLSSPQHGGGHRRTISRHGSGLSRLISKNWEADMQMEMMIGADVDADISSFPVGGGLVIDVAERPASPSSRLVDQAGILFGSASGAAATAHHTLEPSPLAAGLQPRHSTGAPAGAEAALGSSSIGSGGVMFAADGSGGLAQRTTAVRDRSRRSELTAAAFGGMTRSGSQGALAHLSRVGGVPGEGAPTEEQEAARRAQRADAAATAAQEHREVKLAEMRSRRLLNSDDAEDETALIDVPDNLQRLSSFLGQGQRSPLRTATADKEAVAALARGEPLFRSVTEEMHELGRLARGPTVDMVTAEALQEEARALFKHMSIDEVDAVAAVNAYAKELEVMPTIPAAPSSDLEVASAAPSLRASASEEHGASADSLQSHHQQQFEATASRRQ